MIRRFARTAVLAVAALSLVTASPPAAAAPLYWTPQTQMSGQTSLSPGACGYDTVVWRAVDPDTKIFITIDGRDWTLPDTTVRSKYSPDVECLNGRVIVAYTGLDNHIYVTVGTGPMLDWSEPVRVTSQPAATKPSINATTGGGQHYQLWMAWHDGTVPRSRMGWLPYDGPPAITWGLEQVIDDGPRAVSNGGVSIALTGYGATAVWANHHLYYSVYNHSSSSWSGPYLLGGGGGTNHPPEIGGDNIVVWRGLGEDSHIWYTRRTSAHEWQPQAPICSVGGTSAGPTLGSNRLVWKGATTDTRLWASNYWSTPSGGTCPS